VQHVEGVRAEVVGDTASRSGWRWTAIGVIAVLAVMLLGAWRRSGVPR